MKRVIYLNTEDTIQYVVRIGGSYMNNYFGNTNYFKDNFKEDSGLLREVKQWLAKNTDENKFQVFYNDSCSKPYFRVNIRETEQSRIFLRFRSILSEMYGDNAFMLKETSDLAHDEYRSIIYFERKIQ